MKQAVIGSRGINRFDFKSFDLTDVISGGAKGIDTAIKNYCTVNNIPIKEIKPDYKLFGKLAPLVRNREIVNECDIIYAIWDGKSRGTRYVIEYAIRKGKEVIVCEVK